MLLGIVGAALATAILTERLSFNPGESRFVEMLHTVSVQDDHKGLSARIIQRFFMFVKARRAAEALRSKRARARAMFAARAQLEMYINSTVSKRKKYLRMQAESRLSIKAVVDDIHSQVSREM